VPVALITSDAGTNDVPAAAGAPAQRLLTAYAEQAAMLADQGARAIVLPEKLVYVTPETAPAADALFQPIADRTGATLVVGVDFESPSVAWNQARVYRPHQPVLTYAKHHLLPPFEDKFRPGTWRTTWSASTATWGTAICKDMDFTPLSRHYGQDGAGLMLVPGWDFDIDRGFHGHIAVMRAVEDGFSLVRAAKNGYLTVTDNRGRILAERRSDAAPATQFVTLTATVPATHSPTLFQLIGDAFAWLAIALLLIALAASFRPARTRIAADPPLVAQRQ
jgi:apolipoprotein N-acyltransferase